MANPDLGSTHVAEIEKKTAECIDVDGWLHSGDKGMLTVMGMVKITGRYKELIIGEGGENIAPVGIEDSVKKLCDGVCEVMMVGDKRKYNVAVITLKAVGANGEVPGTDNLDAGAKRVNPEVTTISGAMDDKTWIEAIRNAIQTTNKNEKVCINNAYTIQGHYRENVRQQGRLRALFRLIWQQLRCAERVMHLMYTFVGPLENISPLISCCRWSRCRAYCPKRRAL